MNSNTIQKSTLLRADHDRVWKALANAEEFGGWFGARFDAPFQAGATLKGAIAPTTVDPDVAEGQRAYEGKAFEFTVEAIEPQRLISFRWHPYAIEDGYDYSQEPTTLIEFTLEDVEGGVLLTVTESGFENIPLERRAKAFSMNEGGWTVQLTLIEKYLAQGG